MRDGQDARGGICEGHQRDCCGTAGAEMRFGAKIITNCNNNAGISEFFATRHNNRVANIETLHKIMDVEQKFLGYALSAEVRVDSHHDLIAGSLGHRARQSVKVAADCNDFITASQFNFSGGRRLRRKASLSRFRSGWSKHAITRAEFRF